MDYLVRLGVMGAVLLGGLACGQVPQVDLVVPLPQVVSALQQVAEADKEPAVVQAHVGHCDVEASLAYLSALQTGQTASPAAWQRGLPTKMSPPLNYRLQRFPELFKTTTLPKLHLVPTTQVPRDSRAAQFAQAPFALVLGSGYFGMFEHLGFLRALARLQLQPAQVAGISSGALTGGLATCTNLQHTQESMLHTSLGDFADPTPAALAEGAWFAGEALQKKLQAILAPYGKQRLEECDTPLGVLAFNVEKQETRHLTRGPIAASLRASAALPKLFAPVRLEDGDRYIDGGWLDPHGLMVLQAGQAALIHRLIGLTDEETQREATSLHRPVPDEALPTDTAHATVYIDNPDRLNKWQVFWQLDWDKAKLRRIIVQHEACALSWLLSAPIDA